MIYKPEGRIDTATDPERVGDEVPAWDRLFIDGATEEELADAYADLTDEEKARWDHLNPKDWDKS